MTMPCACVLRDQSIGFFTKWHRHLLAWHE